MDNRIIYLLAIIILTASPLSVPAQQSGAAPAEVLTLDQAISLALRDNRQVKNSQLAVGKAGDEVAAARTFGCRIRINVLARSQQLVKHDHFYQGRWATIADVGPFPDPDRHNVDAEPADGDFFGQVTPATVATIPHPPGHQAGRVSARVEGEKLRRAGADHS